MALSPGARFGPYTVLGSLGRGGMASVYKCHEPALDRHIALKVLPREFLHDETFAERFRREAKVIARLEHPNIVPIHAFGIEDGVPWMAMRCIAGGSLSGLLKNRRIDERRVLGILRGTAEALDHAHGQGIVHRDVKPQNILLDDAGRVYLADFGIAKMAESSGGLTATGMITGTPQYMAPEQAKGVPLDHRADVYALGVVAYELLTGRTPFAADTPVAILMKHLSEPVPRPSALDLPGAASDVLIRCLAKEPVDRWPTAGAFVEALEQALGPAATTLVPLSPTQPQPAPETTRQAPRPMAARSGAAPLGSAAPPQTGTPPSSTGWLLGVAAGVAVLVLLGLGGVWLVYKARHDVETSPPPVAEAPPVAISPSGTPPAPGDLGASSPHPPVASATVAAPASSPAPTPTTAATGPTRPLVSRPTPEAAKVPPAPAPAPPVAAPKPSTPSEIVPTAPAPVPAAPGGSEGGARPDATLAFTQGVAAPLALQSGAISVGTVRFQVKPGKSGRFKRIVANDANIATVQAAIELLRKPKAGDWTVSIGVELLDANAHAVAAFEESVTVEDDRSTVNLVHELGKNELARVTRARIRLEAAPD